MGVTNMIIVCSDSKRKFGDYLAQLISSIPKDGDQNLAGIKVVVWSIKDYKHNSAQTTSDQYILFIGNNKLIKDKRSHMKLQYDKFNMHYGWLGHQASLNVGYTVSALKYASFMKYFKELVDQGMPYPNINYQDFLRPFLAVITPVPIQIMNMDKMIREQMYSCLTYAFFVYGLKDFLNQ